VRSGAKALAALAALAMTGLAACGSSNDGSATKASGSSAQGTKQQPSAPAWLKTAQTAAAEATKIPTTVPSGDLGPFNPPKGKTIYHVACNLALEGCSKIANAIEGGTKALGYKFEKCDGGTTADKIGACFTNAVNAKPDAIVVNGIDVNTAGDGYAAAAKAGIPIIGTFTGNPDGAKGVKTEVAGDACTKEGAALANWIIADSGGKANALFVGTKTYACNIQRQESFISAMKACQTCSTDTLEFAIDAIQSGLPQQLQSAIQTKPNVTYIVGTFDAVALAATDAVRQAGKSGAIKVAGFDADAPNLELIKKGDIQVADITTGSTEPGWAAADAAGRAIAGASLPPVVSTSQVLLTKDNLGQIGKTYVGATGFDAQFKKLWNLG
jgi:ribose transport system substrate-binding protein